MEKIKSQLMIHPRIRLSLCTNGQSIKGFWFSVYFELLCFLNRLKLHVSVPLLFCSPFFKRGMICLSSRLFAGTANDAQLNKNLFTLVNSSAFLESVPDDLELGYEDFCRVCHTFLQLHQFINHQILPWQEHLPF